MLIKIHFLIAFFLFSFYSLFASEFAITGKVVDKSSKESLTSATIVLLNPSDSLQLNGGKSDRAGKFKVNTEKAGEYLIRVSYIGYEPGIYGPYRLTGDRRLIDIGDIGIEPTAAMLSPVEITAEKSILEFSAGKKIINVDKNLITSGANALDVMKALPSINVDIDGNISLRGSENLKILIDGKPSSLMSNPSQTLERIPAGLIDKVEIITNPSAKYDAEGMAGMINIILKKSESTGLNGITSLNAGTGDKYSGSVNLNYSLGTVNFFTGYDFRSDIRNTNGSLFRESFFTRADSIYYLNLDNRWRRKNINHTFRAGFDYNISTNDKLSSSFLYRFGNEFANELTTYNSRDNFQNFFGNSKGYFDDDMPNDNYDINLNYSRLLGNKSNKLNVDFYFSNSENTEDSELMRYFYEQDGFTPIDSIYGQKSNYDELFSNTYGQIVYETDSFLGNKLELGFKSTYRKSDVMQSFTFFDETQGQWQLNPNNLNQLLYQEYIQAAYLTYGFIFESFDIQLGMRIEQTNTSSRVSEDNSIKKSYLDYFPNLSISYKIDKLNQLQFIYSRRIERPGLSQISPFVDYGDPLNLRFGNPDLMPEYTNSLELDYIKNIEKLSLSASLFYRHSTDRMMRYIERINDYVMGMTFKNLGTSNSAGFEISASGDMTNWWKINANGSYYYSNLEVRNSELNINKSDYLWNARLTSNFTISDDLSLQSTFFYTSPNITVQGRRHEMYSFDIGARFELFDRRLSLTANWSDVFDISKFQVDAEGDGFKFTRKFKRETSVFTIGFTYRLSDMTRQNDRDKRRNASSERERMDME